MNFTDLDKQMRVFETAHDHQVLPDMWLVARLDGRNFTTLTKQEGYNKPFDPDFRDMMIRTLRHLFRIGFKVLYGYTESDEISLLFAQGEEGFGRKLRKLNSILAGEASAEMSLLQDCTAVFDCRISQLPNVQRVVDYFRWRQADAARNGLNSICYWTMRNAGEDKECATLMLGGKNVAWKHDMLKLGHDINYNELPAWQRRGVGVYSETYVKEGHNPKTDEVTHTTRRRLTTDLTLPFGDDYGRFVRGFLEDEDE